MSNLTILESLLDFDRRWHELIKSSRFYDFESLINKFMVEMDVFIKEDGSVYNVSDFLTQYEIHSINKLDKDVIKAKLLAFIHKVNDEVLKLPPLSGSSVFYKYGAKGTIKREPPHGNEP
jgi:hypothetical protein